MRLKSLELLGFKSFLDSTTISFAPGMTAVVGPNGCGKSNVVDAIRWVLGEQAPTRLRGKSVEDLIYAGNESNPAAGMAEVSLVLEAEDGSQLPEPYSALSEVAVTRRAYRSGESEYLLNKIPCRLKDITEFFMAAQIHSRGYSLVEQGRIEEIIQAKPHELRTLVEEAAGLSLFKGRREMSERKLERVKENLARVDDVLSEIERQLSFARRQAKKAETYKVVKAELGELERYSAARRLIDQREELATQNSRDAELKSALDGARAGNAAIREQVEAAASAAQSARSELGGAQRELENLHSGANERARTRAFLQRRLDATAQLEIDLARAAGRSRIEGDARARQSRRGGRDSRARNRGGRRRRRRRAQGNLAQARSGDSRTQGRGPPRRRMQGRSVGHRARGRRHSRPPRRSRRRARRSRKASRSYDARGARTRRRARNGARVDASRRRPTSKRRAQWRSELDGARAPGRRTRNRSAHRARPSDGSRQFAARRAGRARRDSIESLAERRRSAAPHDPRIAQRRPSRHRPFDSQTRDARAAGARTGAQSRARRSDGRGDSRVAAVRAPRNRNPQRESRRPHGLRAGTRRCAGGSSGDRRARNRGTAGRDARNRIALLAGRRSDARSRDACGRSAFGAGGVESQRSRHRFRNPRRRPRDAGADDQRRQRRRQSRGGRSRRD